MSFMTKNLVVRNEHILRPNATFAVEDAFRIVFALDFQKPGIILTPESFWEFWLIDVGLGISAEPQNWEVQHEDHTSLR